MVGQSPTSPPRADQSAPDDANRLADLLDAHGFLKDPELWSRDIALGLAAEMHVGELSEAHWRVIDRLRSDYLEHGTLLVQTRVCRELDLAPDCVLALFGGPIEAWQLAGLPDPGEEARTYMENQEAPEAEGIRGAEQAAR